MADDEFSRVTGAPAGWLEGKGLQPNLFAARMQFDIRELNYEYVQMVLKAVNEAVIPSDVTGATDRAKWTKVQWRMINPQLARELVIEEGPASQKLYNDVNQQMALMALANQPQMVENDPAAEQKLMAAVQIIRSNPLYQQLLAGPTRFAATARLTINLVGLKFFILAIGLWFTGSHSFGKK